MLSSILLAGTLLTGMLHPTDTIAASAVTSDKGVTVSRRDTIHTSGSFTIAEALMKNPALTVNDNGGIAGLKTVSIRGIGSAHTSIYIDGVRVGNVQSGQNNLGMLNLADISSVVIDYAQNSIYFNSARPQFDELPVAGVVKMDGGSFNTYLPTARFDFKLSESLSLRATASGIFSKGDFPYTFNGENLTRVNNDISQIRSGLDLFGLMNKGDYHVKAYFNSTRRGTPGSTSWPSDDRQEDMSAYLQGCMNARFSPLYTLKLSLKGSYDDIFYSSTWGDSQYGQTEVQLNSAHLFTINDKWSVSLAEDIFWDDLSSTVYNQSRISSLTALASSFKSGIFSADIAMEYNFCMDGGEKFRDALSPSAKVRVDVLEGMGIYALGRRMYRIPTFNELYYTGYGNPELKPEDAWTTDLGIDFNRKIGSSWNLKANLNGFLTTLTDKIVSAPTEADPDIWLPYNVGKVRSAGFDAVAGFVYTHGEWTVSFDGKHTFLSATDRTPDSMSYGTQLPYIAKHSTSLNGDIRWNSWSLNTLWINRCGYRDNYGEMPGWNTLDLSLGKNINMGKAGLLTIRAAVKNIFDTRYELSSGYPMPGRSIIGGIEYKF